MRYISRKRFLGLSSSSLFTLFGALALFFFSALQSSAQTAPDGFNPNPNGLVIDTVVQPADGKILVGGAFTTIAGQARTKIARFNADGTLDTAFNPVISGSNSVNAVGLQSDGKILIGGFFPSVNGQARSNIARLNTDGTLDTSFAASVNGQVNEIAVQTDGKILIGGGFSVANGVSRTGIARLNSDGTLDTSFNPIFNDYISAVVLQPDGKILVGGNFTSVNGIARSYIVRLNPDGSVDGGFAASGINDSIQTVAVQPDGKVLIGGIFTQVGGAAHARIARLNADGSLDSTFNAQLDNGLLDIAVQSDGKILVGGYFRIVNGTLINRLARLNVDGTIDSSFTTQTEDTPFGDNVSVTTITVQPNNRILVGGSFQTLGGQPRPYLGRVAPVIAPTAAEVTISGRVMSSRKRGIARVRISLTLGDGTIRKALTNAFGYYSIPNVEAGQTVIIEASAKQYTFATQVLNLTEDATMVNFLGE